jgi:hypothetical protein
MSENENKERSLREIEELLPWHAAGTLDAATAKRVEEALAREPGLRNSLRLAREDREETIALNEELGAPSGRAWARVLANANAEPRKPNLVARFAALAERAASWLGAGATPRPRRLAWAGAAAVLVIALEAATILSLLSGGPSQTYRTASQPSASTEGATLILAFAPEARAREIADLLRRRNASIVDGPRAGGLFRVRVGDKSMSRDEIEAVLASLRAEPIVLMALPGSER